MRNCFLLVLLILFITSCRTVSGVGDFNNSLSTQPLLGTVGTYSNDLISAKFTEVGVPQLDEKIRISIEKKNFNKRSIREYNKKVSNQDQKLVTVDSLDLKPKYYKLQISDKIGLIDALHSPANATLKNYLEATGKNVILTSLSIYFPDEISDSINNASEIYLVNNKKNSFSLEILNKDRTRKIIEFNDGISFGYNFSGFCWGLNHKRQPEIMALREKGSSCPGETRKKPGKLKGKDIFEKYN